jgi:uncharacterized protein YqeY
MSAAAFKDRLRRDLKAAMQARAADEVRVLRTLIAALDNAEAVPVEDPQDKYVRRAFGDPSGEVARQVLDRDAVEVVLKSEIEARLAAATGYDTHEQREQASRLRGEAALIERYRTP